MTSLYYRYFDRSWDHDGDTFLFQGNVVLIPLEFIVVRRTPKGVWIHDPTVKKFPNCRFILNDSKKRFACETKEKALVSFLARKKLQLGYLKANVIQVVDAIALAEKMISEGKT